MKRDWILKQVRDFRTHYQNLKSALPWLDLAVYEDEGSVFPKTAADLQTESVKTADAAPELANDLNALKAKGVKLLRLRPNTYDLDELDLLLNAMAAAHMPLIVYHTHLNFEAVRKLALARPSLDLIIEAGPRKLIYHINEIKDVLKVCPNVYLCSYNFMSWRGHEELAKAGLGGKLIYGSHMPMYCADAAMGPVIMGDLSWKQKCDIAGNTLRRLLGLELITPPEVSYAPPPPFVIDAHAHNLQPHTKTPYAMPTPDLAFTPQNWLDSINRVATERLFLTPGEALFDASITCQDYTKVLRGEFDQ